MNAKQKYISSKIAKVNREGLHGKPPVKGQAAAVAYSEWRRKNKR